MKFKLSVFNLSKFPVELLYDYSTALNGYRREIHRDSDNRLIVFLLYLNPISKEATGGSLDIYKLKDKNKTSFEAQPKNEDCELVEQIKPDYGKLVIFQNTDVSYHAVSEMKESVSCKIDADRAKASLKAARESQRQDKSGLVTVDKDAFAAVHAYASCSTKKIDKWLSTI